MPKQRVSAGIFQSKTRTVNNENKNFQNFLSPYPVSSYKNSASKFETFFDLKVDIALIIEAQFFCFRLGVLNLSHLDFDITNIEFTLDVSSHAFLSGDIRISSL